MREIFNREIMNLSRYNHRPKHNNECINTKNENDDCKIIIKEWPSNVLGE